MMIATASLLQNPYYPIFQIFAVITGNRMTHDGRKLTPLFPSSVASDQTRPDRRPTTAFRLGRDFTSSAGAVNNERKSNESSNTLVGFGTNSHHFFIIKFTSLTEQEILCVDSLVKHICVCVHAIICYNVKPGQCRNTSNLWKGRRFYT